MKNLIYTIEESVFKIFPDFTRAVLVCQNFSNEKKLVFNFEGIAATVPFNLETISATADVVTWRKAFRAMGIDPTKDRVSFEALTRRVITNGVIKNINYLVDLGNSISIKHQCPVGVHPLDGLNGKIVLKEAIGDENFTPLGGAHVEHPQPGEFILLSGNDVLTRRFCWRQGINSIVSESTRSFFVNFDFLNKDAADSIPAIITEFTAELCKVSPASLVETDILDAKSNSYNFQIDY